MNAVTNDFPAGEIFAYLKTDLLNIERDEIDLLENYCLAFGITANDWKSDKPWKYAAQNAEQFDEERVNRIRKKAIAPLLELKKKLGDAAGDNRDDCAGTVHKNNFRFSRSSRNSQTVVGLG